MAARVGAVALLGQRLKSWLGWGEGSWLGPFSGVGERGGIFTLSDIEDGWQRNLSIAEGSRPQFVPAAFAAVMAYARAVSQCWPRHMREEKAGTLKFDRVTTSPAFRVLRQPNQAEVWPLFVLNLVARSLFEGEALAVATRDVRGAITGLHRMPHRALSPFINPDDGAVYYYCGARRDPSVTMPNDGTEYILPGRDVLHLRFFTPRHALVGESLFKACAMSLGINVALSQSQYTFFNRMSRPSGILSTEQQLTAEQRARLIENWKSQSVKMAQGGVPILSNGMKWYPMTITSEDAQLIEAQRLSIEDIARVLGVPLPVIGDLSHATLTNTETLINFWLATSLGPLLEMIERELDKLFEFDGVHEYVDLDTTALQRTDFAGRIDALTKAIQGGLLMPNEARAMEGKHPVPEGDKVYAQAQMQPLGTPLAAPPPAPAPDAPAPADEPAPDATADEAKQQQDEEEKKQMLVGLISKTVAEAVRAQMAANAETQAMPVATVESRDSDPDVARALVAQIILKAKAHA